MPVVLRGASGPCQRCPEQLVQVVGGAYQRPFPIHLLQAPQSELIQASGALDLAKHRFNNDLAQGVDRLASLGSELASIRPRASRFFGDRPAMALGGGRAAAGWWRHRH
jgi:hypothetical protein